MGSGKILLLDDELPVRTLFQLYLEDRGYVVVSASSISEALRILEREDISLGIIDIFLQEDNGLELLRGIVAARPKLPVLIMSGVADGDLLFSEALKIGAAGVYSKTLPLTNLVTEVARILNRPLRPV